MDNINKDYKQLHYIILLKAFNLLLHCFYLHHHPSSSLLSLSNMVNCSFYDGIVPLSPLSDSLSPLSLSSRALPGLLLHRRLPRSPPLSVGLCCIHAPSLFLSLSSLALSLCLSQPVEYQWDWQQALLLRILRVRGAVDCRWWQGPNETTTTTTTTQESGGVGGREDLANTIQRLELLGIDLVAKRGG